MDHVSSRRTPTILRWATILQDTTSRHVDLADESGTFKNAALATEKCIFRHLVFLIRALSSIVSSDHVIDPIGH
jgi:hypothetical protein